MPLALVVTEGLRAADWDLEVYHSPPACMAPIWKYQDKLKHIKNNKDVSCIPSH
ncbi:hypothetical protein Mapa_012451 [Marchantia paleacea]|nr:hypothetical protein Mapa_012451 [Marchantia paleacea]